MAVSLDDPETAFSVSRRLGIIGDDNTEAILFTISQAIRENAVNKDDALKLAELIEGREIDFIDLPYMYNLFCFIYHSGGLLTKADSLLDYRMHYNLNKIDNGELSYKYQYEISQIYAIKGDYEKSYQWLEKSINAGWLEFPFGIIDPLFVNMRDQEKFQQLIRQTKFKVDSLQLVIPGNPDKII
jgi:hypothetical protein